MGVTLDRETHTYRTTDGTVLPSVTQVLRPMIESTLVGIPDHVLEVARLRGQHVHRAVELDIRGALDEASLDDVVGAHLEQWRKFERDSGAVVLASERCVHHERLGYAGTLDLILGMPSGKSLVVDIKTAATCPPWTGPQCVAYWRTLPAGRQLETTTHCLTLRSDGYRLTPLLDMWANWQTFLGHLNNHRKQEN